MSTHVEAEVHVALVGARVPDQTGGTRRLELNVELLEVVRPEVVGGQLAELVPHPRAAVEGEQLAGRDDGGGRGGRRRPRRPRRAV